MGSIWTIEASSSYLRRHVVALRVERPAYLSRYRRGDAAVAEVYLRELESRLRLRYRGLGLEEAALRRISVRRGDRALASRRYALVIFFCGHEVRLRLLKLGLAELHRRLVLLRVYLEEKLSRLGRRSLL